MGGLAAAVADPREEPKLLTAVLVLRQLEAEVAAVDRFRPWIAAWGAVDEVVARLRSVARHYLASASAALPIDAQREARLAQVELDSAADPASQLSEFTELWEKAEAAETAEELLAQFTERAFAGSGASSIMEFDRAEDQVFRRVTGHSGCPVGLGSG